MTKYALREFIPADRCRGSLDYVYYVTSRMRRGMLDQIDKQLVPGVPLAVNLLVDEQIDAYGNRQTTMELETKSIRTVNDIIYHPQPVANYLEYNDLVHKEIARGLSIPASVMNAHQPKKTVLQRLASWWKEMQKPMPYDGPRG